MFFLLISFSRSQILASIKLIRWPIAFISRLFSFLSIASSSEKSPLITGSVRSASTVLWGILPLASLKTFKVLSKFEFDFDKNNQHR